MTRLIIFTVAAALCMFLVWANYFKLDVASYATGQVIPAGQVKRVQHLEGGIIDEILVVEGQSVEAGQVIATLQAEQVSSELVDISTRIGILEQQIARVEALLSGTEILELPAPRSTELAAFANETIAAFETEKATYGATLEAYEKRVAAKNLEIEEVQQRLRGLSNSIRLLDEQIDISANLLARNLTSDFEHLALRRERANLVGDVNTAKAGVERIQTQIEEEGANRQAFVLETELDLRRELQELSGELSSLREQARRPADSKQRLIVRAPVAGTIKELGYQNSGAVVAPGGTVATLVPLDDELLVEAELPIGEVGYVRVGSRAKLTLASGTGGFEMIEGEVILVSPDSVMDEQTGVAHFVVRLRPEKFAFARGEETYPLAPGVPVMAAILSGERSVLGVLLEPILGSGIQPLSER